MQDTYPHMQDIYVYMPDNYVFVHGICPHAIT